MREISYEETDKLYDCLEELAKHHNKVSAHFEGYYPITPSEQRIESFKSELKIQKLEIGDIDVKVVFGNNAIDFYKRYGFLEKSIVLGLCMEI